VFCQRHLLPKKLLRIMYQADKQLRQSRFSGIHGRVHD